MRALGPLVLAALVAAGCQQKNPLVLRAFQATSRTQLIGGTAAVADVGDFVIENDQARFVILGVHGSPGPGIFGGSLADADLQRNEPEFRDGNGLDSLSEIFPVANLTTPNPARWNEHAVAIEDDGTSGEEAVIRVSAYADNYMDALGLLKDGLGVPMNIRVQTRYRLRPKERVLRMETWLDFNPPSDPKRADEREMTAMQGLVEPPNIFGIILRIPVRDADKPAPGAISGDFLFYGNKTDVFTPGYGFDIDTKLREIFNGGCDTVNVPIGVDQIAAEGDRVSYSYASADEGGGKTYVPLFASSFTAVMTHKFECDSKLSCLGGKRLVYTRLFAVGDGDAASAMKEIYKAKNVPFGTVQGRVFDSQTGQPVSGARVLALRDPGPGVVSDADLARLTPEEALGRIYKQNREKSAKRCTEADPSDCQQCAPNLDPYGEPGIVTSMKTDRGTDRVLDGDFSGALEPGDYLLVVRDRTRPTSHPKRVHVAWNKVSEVSLAVDPAAELTVRITDEKGQPMPGKVTLGRCLPECANDGDCGDGRTCDKAQHRCFPGSHGYEQCVGKSCTCSPNSLLDVALGDPLNPDNIQLTTFADANGVAHVKTRPGDWEIIVSRGLEYDLSRQDVRLDSRRPVETPATLHRVVDTTGWISGDFHVHGINSHDAFVNHELRVKSMMGEGVELLSSSDHDAITDFAPAVHALGAEKFIKTQVGLETTTVEMGHFIGHPLRFDQLSTGAGLMPGRAGAFDWYGLPPGEADYCDKDNDGTYTPLKDQLVAPGDPDHACGKSPVLRDPGIFGRLRALGLYGPGKTVVTVPHPRDGFFGYFDQFELSPYSLLLGERGAVLESLNPLIKPQFFSPAFDAIEIMNGKRFDFIRTPTLSEIKGFGDEMKALKDAGLPNDELERRQALVGEKWVKEIIKRTKEEQSRVLASNGALACQATYCDPQTFKCPGAMQCDRSQPVPECFQGCRSDADCPDRLGTCDTNSGRCMRPPSGPCTDHRGVVDDWFRLLNAGLQTTGVANSDTHGVLSSESGLPRNWVRSKSDEARSIDLGEIAANMLGHQVVASYGPFVRFDVNGVETGGTVVKPQGPVQVHVTVESPLWFDVDRLEIYKNGELWQEVDAGPNVKHAGCAIVDSVPNKQIVHFDCTFADTLDKDSWYVAAAMGLKGKDLRPVYSSVPVLSLEIGDITGRAFGATLPLPTKPPIPRQNPVLPLAYTNPVWVDLDGTGFDPPARLPDDSPFAQKGRFPLTSAGLTGPHLLDEPAGDDARAAQLIHTLQMRLLQAADQGHGRPWLERQSQ